MKLKTYEKPSRLIAIGESFLTTAIWASSFVLIKEGLKYVGPLTLAGLRYFSAFLVLLPFLLRKRTPVRSWSSRLWLHLAAIGVSAYTVGNGALFWGLGYLPATTGSFLMNLIPLLVMFGGIIWLRETPTRWQVVGVLVCLIGSVLFFSLGLRPGEPLGIAVVSLGLISFAVFGILGRAAARDRRVDTLSLTAIPLAIGGGFLLLIAVPVEGWPQLPAIAWGVVLWLAVINTAFAYILYNHALQVLTALEMNVMLSLAPLETAVLAWLFLDEGLAIVQIVGMVIVIAGVIFVQWTRGPGRQER